MWGTRTKRGGGRRRGEPSIIFHVNAPPARRFFLITVLINIHLSVVAICARSRPPRRSLRAADKIIFRANDRTSLSFADNEPLVVFSLLLFFFSSTFCFRRREPFPLASSRPPRADDKIRKLLLRRDTSQVIIDLSTSVPVNGTERVALKCPKISTDC